MDLGQIDYSLKLPEPELWLTDPRKNIMAKITSRSGTQYSRFGKKRHLIKHTQLYKLNSINEMEFSLPFQVEIGHQLVRNSVVDMIKESSLILSKHNGYEEYFTIVDIKRTMDANMDYMTIQCRSLGYELMRQNVRNFKVVAQPLSSLLNGGTTLDSNSNQVSFDGLLNSTLWTLDPNYDTSFDTIYRDIDVSKATILNAIISVAKTFNAIISFNTVNRTVNFQQLKNVGYDKDARISYKNYLKSLENESQIDVLATRIVPAGKNNLTVAGVSLNGEPWIDDFTFYTDGFTRDSNKKVLTHSNQNTSDDLCGALLDYSALLVSSNGNYTSLLTSLNGYRTTLATQTNDMANLKATLASINKQLDYAQQTGGSTTSLLSQQSSQEALISSKQSDINTTNTNITNTQASIASLQATLSTSANFTPAQIQELIPLIRSVDWEDLNISDAQDLYNQAQIQFVKYKTPQILIKVDMVNIFQTYSEQRVWDKFWVGNDVFVEYDVIGTKIKAKIVEMSFDHVEENMTIVVSSVTDLIRNQEVASNMLYQAVSAASTLSVNVDNWNGIDVANKNINAIYNNGIDGAKIALSGGYSTVIINDRGLTSTVAATPNSLIRLNGGVLGFSADGGQTFSTALSATGIYAPSIVGQLGTFVHLDAASVTTGTLSGINMQIGTSPNLFLANTSGISLGATTWAASPFRVDMLGNAYAHTMQLDTPAISNGSITGTSINVNGNFTVNSSGIMSCTGANVSGNITAINGNFSGNITSTATITGGVFQTASSGRRTVMSSNLFNSYDANGTLRISMNKDGVADSSIAFFRDNLNGNINQLSSAIYQLGTQTIFNGGFGGDDIISFFNKVDFNSATVTNIAQSAIIGLSTSLSSKTNVGSTTSSTSVADSHNHGIPDGTVLMKSDGSFITWVAYAGSASHNHTTN